MSQIIAIPPSQGPKLTPVTLQGRLVHNNGSGSSVTNEGNALQQTDFASIACAIYDLDGADPDAAVSTPSIVVASVILDTLTDDEIWTVDDVGRNFIYTVAGSTFSSANRYRIVFTATLSAALDDETFKWAFEHHVQEIVQATPYRVGPDQVRELVDVEDGKRLDPFIRMANTLTNRVVSCDSESALTTAEKEEIELLLAAHFYTLYDQDYETKQTGKASAKFRGITGKGLDFTKWGQMAKAMDHTGCLATLSSGKTRVGASWLGKPPSEQTDYLDRD